MAGLRPDRGFPAAHGHQRARLSAAVLRPPCGTVRQARSAISRPSQGDAGRKGTTDRRSAASSPSDPLPRHVLACRSRLSRPGYALFVAATRYRHPALVALRCRSRLANARETDPALHDHGDRNTTSKLGHWIAHDGSTYPEAASLVRDSRSPSGEDAWQRLRRGAFLSEGGPVRSLSHLRCPN